MSRAAWLLALLGATAVAWLQTRQLIAPARLWTVTLIVPLPALMVLQARQLRDISEFPRRAAYISSIVSLWALALITLLVVRASDYRWSDVGFFRCDLSSTVAWTTGITLAGVAILFLFRALGARETPVLRELLPRTNADRSLFALLSLSAGACEEIAFRGFLLYTLTTATASPLIALVISSGAFGVLHAYQQPAGALRAALLGALLGAPILAGEPIFAAVIAHALIDLLSGLWLARYLLR